MTIDLADPITQDIAKSVNRIPNNAIYSLRNARLLITGGTGFLGSWIVDILLAINDLHQLGMHLTLLTRNASNITNQRPDWLASSLVTFIEGDIRYFSCSETHFSHVIHGATSTNAVAGLEPRELADSIVEGSRNVIDIASRSGAERYLYISSGAVVGQVNQAVKLITEDEPSAPAIDDPMSAYGNAKRYAEHLHIISSTAAGLEMVIARGFAFVGPRMTLNGHFAIGNFIRDALLGDPPHLFSTGTALRSYLYAADAAVWFIVMLTLGKPSRIYNVGSDQPISVRELALIVASQLGSPQPLIAQTEVSARSNYVPNINRARHELYLDVWCSLESAIKRTAAWAMNSHVQLQN